MSSLFHMDIHETAQSLVTTLLHLHEAPSSDDSDVVTRAVVHTITTNQHILADERRDLFILLYLLSTALGTCVITTSVVCKPFAKLNQQQRTKLLRRMATSPFPTQRKAFLALKRLMCGVATSFLDNQGSNPLARNLYGYPGSSCINKLTPAPKVTFATSWRRTCDVVIVGSGAGGGVAAAVLAEAGLSVIVLEKGPYVPPESINGEEFTAMHTMYEKGGLLVTDDGAIGVLAGSTMGGGTTINWACSLVPPDRVREEWAASPINLTQFKSPEFDVAIKAALDSIGASAEGVVHNPANTALLTGCNALAYDVKTAPQNLRDRGASREAGWTCFGDRTANKQGTLAALLPLAVKHGAQVIDNCAVDEVLFENQNGRRRAVGVKCRVAGCEDESIIVRASRAVIISAGSLHSPGVLIRSGVGGRHVGRHLRLHPVTGCVGTFRDREIKCYEGAPMTTVCESFAAGPKDDYYGAKIEVPSAHPGLMSAALVWHGGEEFAKQLGEMNHKAPSIVLQRDGGDGGRVTPRKGNGFVPPVVTYRLRREDEASMLDALEASARIWVAAGADEVMTMQSSVPPHVVGPRWRGVAKEGSNPPLEAWLRSVRSAGLRPNCVSIFSAHQMGTCRMGTNASHSVVDEDGEVWDADRLYVMDASVFPTASGANPMVTTMAISHMLSSRLARRLRSENERSSTKPKRDGRYHRTLWTSFGSGGVSNTTAIRGSAVVVFFAVAVAFATGTAPTITASWSPLRAAYSSL
ncbi:long-chain-alcohol oxidase [Pycnococcus provasolii]